MKILLAYCWFMSSVVSSLWPNPLRLYLSLLIRLWRNCFASNWAPTATAELGNSWPELLTFTGCRRRRASTLARLLWREAVSVRVHRRQNCRVVDMMRDSQIERERVGASNDREESNLMVTKLINVNNNYKADLDFQTMHASFH